MIYSIIVINLIMVPVAAILDYYAFRGRYEKIAGHKPGFWFWLWPCVLEIMMFNAGIVYGMNYVG